MPPKKTTTRKTTTRKTTRSPAGPTTGGAKSGLTKEYGPLPLWGWIAVGGAAWYFYSHVLSKTNETPTAGSSGGSGGGGRVGRKGHRGGGGGGGASRSRTHGQKNHAGGQKTNTVATAPSMTTSRIRTSTREHLGHRTDSRHHRSGR